MYDTSLKLWHDEHGYEMSEPHKVILSLISNWLGFTRKNFVDIPILTLRTGLENLNLVQLYEFLDDHFSYLYYSSLDDLFIKYGDIDDLSFSYDESLNGKFLLIGNLPGLLVLRKEDKTCFELTRFFYRLLQKGFGGLIAIK
jgi:hypothetical protein